MTSKRRYPTRPEDVRFADSVEIERRSAALERFVNKYFAIDLQPFFVSDQANMLDISDDDIPDIIAKIRRIYGIELDEEQIRLPVWKLLDVLESA